MAGQAQGPAKSGGGGSGSQPRAAYASQLATIFAGNNSNNNNSNNNDLQYNLNGQPASNTQVLNNTANPATASRPLILITDSNSPRSPSPEEQQPASRGHKQPMQQQQQQQVSPDRNKQLDDHQELAESGEDEDEQVEVVDGIKYRIVAAVTRPANGASKLRKRRGLNSISTATTVAAAAAAATNISQYHQNQIGGQNSVILEQENETSEPIDGANNQSPASLISDVNECGVLEEEIKSKLDRQHSTTAKRRLNSVRRKSSAFVSSLLQNSFLGAHQSGSNYEICDGSGSGGNLMRPRRLSIYEMTKSPPPETSLEIYLSERRRSSTISSKQVKQQLEQQSTFETNYCQRQQYFKDLNQKLINHDKKLLNVVANRGQIHRHSVDIAQLPLHLAQAKASKANKLAAATAAASPAADIGSDQQQAKGPSGTLNRQLKSRLAGDHDRPAAIAAAGSAAKSATNGAASPKSKRLMPDAINQYLNCEQQQQQHSSAESGDEQLAQELKPTQDASNSRSRRVPSSSSMHKDRSILDKRASVASSSRGHSNKKSSRIIIRKFQKLDLSQLSSTPAPEVKIGQRVAYKEYYGNEFGTIRWIGRVPQICPDWTAGVEFDNAIGEGDGSLNGRRYFIAKDCFAKFLPLSEVAFVDQHVGRPEPGTMISVMSAAVRPGQMISIQRVSTVHVQHCFLNAPHQIPGADILAVNTRLHCQCPNCGPCAHVIKPPRTQRLARSKKNATHMCQFSTYTCCGMESQEEAMCAYTGNRATSSLPLPPPQFSSSTLAGWPPIGNSWIEGSGYLTNLQAQQSKMMPEEYKMGAAPEDAPAHISDSRRGHSNRSSRRGGSGKHRNHRHKNSNKHNDDDEPDRSNAQQSFQELSEQTAPAYAPEIPPPQPVDWQSGSEIVANEVLSAKQQSSVDTNNNKMEPTSRAEQASIDLNRSRFLTGDSNNMQDPPSYSPNPNYTNFNNSNSQQQQQQQALPPSVAFYKKHHTTPYVEPVWCESSSSALPAKSGRPKIGAAAKVIYRDSIENRYLFPTDDPIDSTLEADLENLSQARYGHHSTNLRLANSSKNIFKSLRSLVSCLSAQSNHSEIMERRSENTMKFSELGDRGTTNKAMPVLLASKQHQQQQPMDDDFLVQSNIPNSREEKENLAAFHNQHKLAFNNNVSDNCNHQHQQQTIMRQISSSSDCGFSSASQNSINFQTYHQAANSPHHHQISADEKRKRIQIYNNFLAHLMNSTTMNEDDLNRLRRVLFETHFIDNCCLHGSSINQVSLGSFSAGGEAEQILLAEGIKKSACLLHAEKGYEQVQRPSSASYHTNANYHSTNNSTTETSKLAQGDRLRKNLNLNDGDEYCLNMHHEGLQSLGNHVNKFSKRSLIDGSSSTASESATLSSHDSFSGTAVIYGAGDNQSTSSSKDIDGGRRSSSVKSRTESDKLTNLNNPTNLPKAFELKLTLSINNSEKSKDQSSSKDPMACGPIDVSNMLDETNGNLLNSTFNINIISQKRKEEPIEQKMMPAEKEDPAGQSKDLNNNISPETDCGLT